jgi:prepilin-type N-terminal cleavage/methylation domain-containing protein
MINTEVKGWRSTQKSPQSGFTLIETAIVLVIVGLIASGGIIGWATYNHLHKVNMTEDRMNALLDVLSIYAQRHNRLPCPAEPFGTGKEGLRPEVSESGPPQHQQFRNCLVSDTGTTADDIYMNMQGVLPWHTLGLPEERVRDAWGRYFTYKPAPNLTIDVTSNSARDLEPTQDANTTLVANACRSRIWQSFQILQSPQPPGLVHADRAKALFCCNANPDPDYLGSKSVTTSPPASWRDNAVFVMGPVLANADSATVLPSDVTSGGSAAPILDTNRWVDLSLSGSFATNTPLPPAASTIHRVSGIGVTLISHGGDGLLAFARNAANYNPLNTNRVGARVTNAGLANIQARISVWERLQVWPSHIVAAVMDDPRLSGNSFDIMGRIRDASDDIVMYQRGDQLYSRVGGASCARPNNVVSTYGESHPNPINGQCGPANGGTYSNDTTLIAAGRCLPFAGTTQTPNSGLPSAVSLSGSTWSWTCGGAFGGTSANCTATRP